MNDQTIEAIIFDIGGVIYRAGDRPYLREKWAPKCGLDFQTFDDVVFNSPLYDQAAIGEITGDELWADRNRMLKLPPADLQTLIAENWNGVWDKEVLNFIMGLTGKFKLGILSDATSGARERVQKHVDLSLFDAVVFSYEVGCRKPDPRIYNLTLERMGVAAENAIFIDDRPRCIEGAQAVGLHVILYEEFDPFLKKLESKLAASCR